MALTHSTVLSSLSNAVGWVSLHIFLLLLLLLLLAWLPIGPALQDGVLFPSLFTSLRVVDLDDR